MINQIEKTRRKNTSYTNYQEDDYFRFSGNEVLSVLEFWRFCYGDLAGQSPMIAEFLVAKALGIEKAENVTYWTAYDMSYRNKRIEVKATEYVHVWNKKRVSKVRTFSIAPSDNRYWGKEGERKLSRQNDLYVVETSSINRYANSYGNPDQKTISLNVIKRMAGSAVNWDGLKDKIDEIINMEKTDENK